MLYVAGCHSREALLVQVAVRTGLLEPGPEVAALVTSRKLGCFRTKRPFFGRLMRWAGGHQEVGRDRVSMWEIVDEVGDREFILLEDFAGPHTQGSKL